VNDSSLRDNHLLHALSSASLARIRPHLEFVPLSLGQVVRETGAHKTEIYFPVTAIVSTLLSLKSGVTAEIALTGPEGMIGLGLFLGNSAPMTSTRVQLAGIAMRAPAQRLEVEFKRGGSFQQVLLRYTSLLIAQTSITAICNRHHRVEQQFCRWLLSSHDRAQSDELPMTHELIANMLGVRRQGVAEVAQRLRKRGLIRYNRGHVTVLNRSGLEEAACECYDALNEEQKRLVGMPNRSIKESNLRAP
jgi:CRP-like cAMP-binding protein